ncbi:MAG: biotin/lipoyl-binding protein [bacterium]|nr:biotin/lipoyl-binding protein [bacterium]
MQKMRDTVGPDVDLQILTRSVSGVTLTTQNIESLGLQAKLMQKYGTTWDRNFDFMNDVGNLIKTGKPIVDAGMHHQVCVALMGLPFKSDVAHTPEFYINTAKELLEGDIKIDSICMKDASGTTDPMTVYKTAQGIKKLMPPEMPLWFHTHDTASMAVACYMAAIEGGADGIDLSVRPMASGTAQPDVRSMAHALKGTGFSLDVDETKMDEIESILTEDMKDYDFNPVVLAADARVVGFPMPGGAIGPNVHMMKSAGILDRYSDVLKEFPVVVEKGGAWTSVTPGSQQYWVQAFNNVLYGAWEKIDMGYGKSVLGYFGKTPLPSDPEVIKIASEQLELPVFDGDPLEAAPNNIPTAKAELEKRGLSTDEKSVFMVVSAMVPGKSFDSNEGIKLLSGKPTINLPLKKKEEPKAKAAAPAAAAAAPAGPSTTTCTVDENGSIRTFKITIGGEAKGGAAPAAPAAAPAAGEPVFAPFDGTVPVVEMKVKEGDTVTKGQVVAAIEAMKAKHDVKSPVDGTVAAIHVAVGNEVEAGNPILTIAPKGA